MIRQFGLSLLLLSIAGSFDIVRSSEVQQTGSLTIEVSELRSQEGNVCLKLFSSGEGFPNDDENALQITCVSIASTPATELPDSAMPSESATLSESAEPSPPATSAPASDELSPSHTESVQIGETEPSFRYTFDSLPYGNYAVAIYHDRNSDERLNRGLFGMPEEGYGFSNDAPASFGPADFADAEFALTTPTTTLPIKMRYP